MKNWGTFISISIVLFALSSPRITARYASGHDSHSKNNETTPSDVEHKPRNSKALRAHILAIGTWVISTANYWLEGAKWEEDIDFRLTFSDQTKRLFSLDSYRFDSNRFATNWQHAFSGALYYNFYRSNDFSLLKSFTYSLYASLLWEYVSEYQEVISINDMAYNTLGALTAGENLFQMGSVLQGQKNAIKKSLGFLLNPVMALNSLLDGKNRASNISQSSFENEASFRISVSKGDLIPLEGEQRFVSTRLSIDLLPEPSAEGTILHPLRWQNRYMAGHFSFSLSGNENGINEYSLKIRNILLGWQMNSGNGQSNRKLLMIGLSNGLSLYRKKAIYPFDTNAAQLSWEPQRVIDDPVAYMDKMSTLGIVGTTLIWATDRQNVHVKLESGINLNFAMINSHPLNKMSEQQVISDTKATLLYYGYYYALGYALSLRGALAYKPLTFQFDFEHHGYTSIEGMDRFQKQLLWDPDLSDSRSFLELGLFVRLLNVCDLGCVYETIHRRGRIDDFTCSERENRFSLTLDFPF